MAQSKLYKFKYADTGFDVATSGSTGTVGHHVFSGNSIFDPDVTGVGVQPYQYDALLNTTAFGYYLVYASKIKVTFYKSDPADNVVLTLVPSNVPALSYVNQDDLRVLPYSRQARMADHHGQISTIKNYCSFMKLRRIAPNSDAMGSFNSNPAARWYWHVFTDSNALATDVACFIDVEITYYCRLSRIDDANES